MHKHFREVDYQMDWRYKRNIAFKLWVYYYTTTEKYDRNLNFTRPSQFDSDVVIPYGLSIAHSNRFAEEKKSIIYAIAKLYDVTEEEMFLEKKAISRLKQSGIEREFDNIDFNFIYKYIEEMEGKE